LKVEILFALVLLTFSTLIQARDVSVQQTVYNNALKTMEKAEEVYKADTQAVADTEDIIQRKQKQLLDEQKKAELSKKRYLESKEKLDQAQAILDQAWK